MTVKIKNLNLKNFAGFSEVDVSFDENVTFLIGNNGAGKSSIGLNAIWFLFEGIAEKSKTALIGERFRFIGSNGKSASGSMTLYDEKLGHEVKVTRHMTKDTTKVSFDAPEGIELTQQWLDDLFNVFMIYPQKFIDLTPKEQALVLGIDTTEVDADILRVKSDLSNKRAVLKSQENNLGTMQQVEPPELVYDLDELKEKSRILKEKQSSQVANYSEQVRKVNEYNKIQKENTKTRNDLEENILKAEMFLEECRKKLSETPQSQPLQEEPLLSTDNNELEIVERQIEYAMQTSHLREKYERFLQARENVEITQKQFEETAQKVESLQEKRLRIIRDCKLPFKELTIDEEGQLLLKGRPLSENYFSTGELLKIVPIILSQKEQDFKFVYLQKFNLLDEDNQQKIIEYLTQKGFQLLIEYVGMKDFPGKHCIVLKENKIVNTEKDNIQSIHDI